MGWLFAALVATGWPPLQAEELLFLLAGQSNMRGRGVTAELPESLRAIPENVRYFRDRAPNKFSQPNYFGPEIGFALTVAEAFPDKTIIIIKIGRGSISVLTWSPDWPRELAATAYNQRVKPNDDQIAAHVRAVDPSRSANLAAIIWLQGERDAQFEEEAVHYERHLSALLNGLRRDLDSPGAMLLISEESPRITEEFEFSALDIVRSAQRKVANTLANALLVKTDGISTDEDAIHYDTAGLIKLGRRFGEAWFDHRDLHSECLWHPVRHEPRRVAW